MFLRFDRLFLYMITISKFSEHLSDWQAGWMRLRWCADVWYFLLSLPFSIWPHALFTMASMMLLRQNLSFPYGLFHVALAVQTFRQSGLLNSLVRYLVSVFIMYLECHLSSSRGALRLHYSMAWLGWSHFGRAMVIPLPVPRVTLLGRVSEAIAQSNYDNSVGQN